MPAPAPRRRSALAAALWLCLAGLATTAGAGERQARTVRAARAVCEESLLGAERLVPRDLLLDTRCIGIFPSLIEAAFGVGGRRGTGVASCRTLDGGWSPPTFISLTEGSVGLQAGYRVTDLMLFFVSDRAARKLVSGKLALGGDATVAAGPIDRSAGASTDLVLAADVYLYGRSRGLFAGVSLEGSRLATRRKANRRFYGASVTATELLFERRVPVNLHPEALALMDALAALPADPSTPAVE